MSYHPRWNRLQLLPVMWGWLARWIQPVPAPTVPVDAEWEYNRPSDTEAPVAAE